METLDSTILTTSLPQIARSLNVTAPELSLAITCYLLSVALFIPICGWVADRYGARRVYCTAMLTFTVGSALCGLAQSLEMLVVTRIIQGIGGAMMVPVGRLIVVRAFPKDQLLAALNYMAIPAMIGPVMGPVVGGFITTYLSWHWIFFLNVPLGLIAVVLTLRLIDDAPLPPPTPFDFKGFAIVAVAVTTGQLAIETIGRDFISVAAQGGLLTASLIAGLIYVRYARGRTDPVLDLTLLRIRTFSIAVLWGSLSRIGLGSITFLLPLLFQVVLGYSPVHAGLLMVATTVGTALMRLGVSRLLRAFGVRRVLVGNALLVGAMLAGFAAFGWGAWQALLVAYLLIFGFLRAIQLSTLNALGYVDLTSELMSRGTSIFAVVQRLSLSSGIAVAAGFLTVLSDRHGHLDARDFALAFLLMAAIEIMSAFGFRRLEAADGAALTGRRSKT